MVKGKINNRQHPSLSPTTFQQIQKNFFFDYMN